MISTSRFIAVPPLTYTVALRLGSYELGEERASGAAVARLTSIIVSFSDSRGCLIYSLASRIRQSRNSTAEYLIPRRDDLHRHSRPLKDTLVTGYAK